MPQRSPSTHGVYVHFPWCRSRCRYCGFSTSAHPAPPSAWWAEGVLAEWELRRGAFPGRAHSLYFGGGTPSLAHPDDLRRVVEAVPLEPDAEVTLEVNPGTVQRLEPFLEAGIHRVSLGAQSFSDERLALLGRIHDVDQTVAIARALRAASARSWSLDLIFSVPGQSPAELDADLDRLVDLGPPHVSLYGLTFEPGTPFDRDRAAGRLVPVPDQDWRAAYERILERLRAAGYERYEVSNLSRDAGHRSRHNEATWRGGHYAGLGPAAHGFEPSGRRTLNHADPERWRADPLGQAEVPSPEQAAIDHVLSTLRHVDGLDLDLLARRTGHSVSLERLRPLVEGGLLATAGSRLRLLDAGFPLADGITARVCAALTTAVADKSRLTTG